MARSTLFALACVLAIAAPLLAAAPTTNAMGPRCAGADAEAAALVDAGVVSFTDEPKAGSWATWVAPGDAAAVLPAPQMASVTTAKELAELHALQAIRTSAQVAAAKKWGTGPATEPWEKLTLSFIQQYSKLDSKQNPPRISRELALLETAMYDALVQTWHVKYCDLRAAPSVVDPTLVPALPLGAAPTYPSEHAAVAAAAATILKTFYPDPAGGIDAAMHEAGESRLWAGVNYRSDVDAGYAIGTAVAQQVLAARANDGSTATWTGTVPTGACNWAPTAPAFAAPLEPAWGHVRPFLMSNGSQFRPQAPPACGGAKYTTELDDIYQASLTLTDRQREIALYWAGNPGSETPPGMNFHIAINESDAHGLDTMRHARVLAHVAAAEADAGIAAWDTKFTYWEIRPITYIRANLDPTWSSLLTTPPFPGYISGHATFTSAGTTTLAYFFPQDAVALRAMATEAADSRFYAGIHVHSDNEYGLAVGRSIGGLAAAHAALDGAD